MHLMPEGAESARGPMTSRRWRARHRARLLRIASQLANYEGPGGGPGVTMDLMRRGQVGVAMSVIYSPFSEIDLSKPYGAPPEDSYFRDATDLIDLVEQDIAAHESDVARVVHSPAELAEALREGKVALVHVIEGGFHLGASEESVRANVAELARRGVASITLAHLFWRRVATNSVAVPLPEWLYRLVFPQPPYEGLSELGVAAVQAMVEHGILVDVAHMSRASLLDTFRVVGDRAPIIASHGACRFGDRDYNLSFDTIARIGQSGGVIGISTSDRHLSNGLRRGRTQTFEETMATIRAHVKRIRDITGSFDHVAIGSDLDGFIRPMVRGLEHMGRMTALQEALRAEYGEEIAEKICNGNVLRLLERHWGAPPREASGRDPEPREADPVAGDGDQRARRDPEPRPAA
ncbi:MAG: dipeptidase [Actinomycetota bacterium]|nr:dipeptidase [Actinomycetota bacterium]